jgi:hypothetical protein
MALSIIYAYETEYNDITNILVDRLHSKYTEFGSKIFDEIYDHYYSKYMYKTEIEYSATHSDHDELLCIPMLNIYKMIGPEYWTTDAIKNFVNHNIITNIHEICPKNITPEVVIKLYVNENLSQIPKDFCTLDVCKQICEINKYSLELFVDYNFYEELCKYLLFNDLAYLRHIPPHKMTDTLLNYLIDINKYMDFDPYAEKLTDSMKKRIINGRGHISIKYINDVLLETIIDINHNYVYSQLLRNLERLSNRTIFKKMLEYKPEIILHNCVDFIEEDDLTTSITDAICHNLHTLEDVSKYMKLFDKFGTKLITLDKRLIDILVKMPECFYDRFDCVELIWTIIKIEPLQYIHCIKYLDIDMAKYLIDINVLKNFYGLDAKVRTPAIQYALEKSTMNIIYMRNILTINDITDDMAEKIMMENPDYYIYLPSKYRYKELFIMNSGFRGAKDSIDISIPIPIGDNI